jgi:hypothetical protein
MAKRQLTKWPNSVQHSTTSYDVLENMNRRTAEQGTAEYRSKKHYLLLSNTSAVRNSVLRTPHPAGGSPVSIFKKIKEAEFHRAGLKSQIIQRLALRTSPVVTCIAVARPRRWACHLETVPRYRGIGAEAYLNGT